MTELEEGQQDRRWYRGISLSEANNAFSRVSTRLGDDAEVVSRTETRLNPLLPPSGERDDNPF
jgi:hypothetical protein